MMSWFDFIVKGMKTMTKECIVTAFWTSSPLGF